MHYERGKPDRLVGALLLLLSEVCNCWICSRCWLCSSYVNLRASIYAFLAEIVSLAINKFIPFAASAVVFGRSIID